MSAALRVPGRLGLGLACLTLTLACAAQREEGSVAQSEARPEVQEDFAAESEPAAMEPAREEDPGERSLEDIERELASHEARLRALGVELAGAAELDLGDASGTATKARDGGPKGKKARKNKDERGADKSGGASTPAARPRAPGAGAGSRQPQQRRDKSKPSKKSESSEDLDAVDDRFAEPPPDEAKSAPLTPNEEPQQDAAGRCIQICDLSVVTCELNAQICELADRHTDEDDYRAACTRASEDCDLAQEACNECAS